MPNERMILQFREFTPYKARRMVEDARDFAVSKPDGIPGVSRGTVWEHGPHDDEPPLRILTRWTRARTVVVAELGACDERPCGWIGGRGCDHVPCGLSQ